MSLFIDNYLLNLENIIYRSSRRGRGVNVINILKVKADSRMKVMVVYHERKPIDDFMALLLISVAILIPSSLH